METRVIIVTGRHRPHELLLLVYGGLIGVATVFRESPGVMSRALPGWVVVLWALALIIAMVVGLTGALSRKPGAAELLELGGMLLAAGAVLLYSFVVFTSIDGWQGAVSGGLLAAWTAANLWRAAQIANDLRALRAGGR